MAYIESHQELATHPKVKRAARMLDTSVPATIGHLHLLWWWAIDHAPDGSIERYDDLDIADAAGWDTNPHVFVEVLRTCGPGGGPGIIDGDQLVGWGDTIVPRRKAGARAPLRPRDKLPRRTAYDLYMRDGYSCRNCDASCGHLQIDHVYPHSRGGSDELDNLQFLCEHCNRAKSDLLPDDWAEIAHDVALTSPCRAITGCDRADEDRLEQIMEGR